MDAGVIALVLASVLGTGSLAQGFGGAPPLGPQDSLRTLLKPYDLVKLNVLGANYCENLLDMRVDATSYTHLGFDSPSSDAWNLQFPDDSARYVEGLVWEDQFSPVVRLETVRRIVKGLLAARVPGTLSDSYFRHRSAGKTFLIFGDRESKNGRLLLSMWGDAISGSLKVGFRARQSDSWLDMSAFNWTDAPESAASESFARTDGGGRYWNESPFVLRRRYVGSGVSVDFIGRYWLSDENKPLEFAFSRRDSSPLQIVVGEPGAPIPLLGDYKIPTTLLLPDRKTAYRSDQGGDRVVSHPQFHYLILRKPGAWGASGYSTALLIAWDGKPDRIEAIADKGFGEIRITYPGQAGRVWLYPYYWLDDSDTESVFLSAEHFLRCGTLLQNGFPSQQLLNAVPAGLAAGAYLLTRYHDPLARTARVNAAKAIDRLFSNETNGKRLVRVFFAVKAAAWMVKTAGALHDRSQKQHYTELLARAMRRMCSPDSGYDGTAWNGGWDHFNCTKACWLAYDATGDDAYRKIWERALTVYTIDQLGIYRYGKRLDAPGGFDTYSGSLPLAVWGGAGMLDRVNTLINLNVPNGWNDPKRPVRDTWNDAGAGPWAQDDANPEFIGLSLRGAHIPYRAKYILPTGAFPSYDAQGKVVITRRPLVHNPFFLPGDAPVRVVPAGTIPRPPKTESLVIIPGSAAERAAAVRLSGKLSGRRRVCCGRDGALVYRLPSAPAAGLGLDLRIRGDGFRVEVSPDGKRWFERLNTWDARFGDQSLDLSFLVGCREELVRLASIAPPDDAAQLVSTRDTTIERETCRYVSRKAPAVYRLDLSGAACCQLELLVGNDYQIDYSSDGKSWRRGVSAADPESPSLHAGADAAVIRMLDVSSCLRKGSTVFLKVANGGESRTFSGRQAFVRRITAYGALRSAQAWVRISNISTSRARSFTIERVELRRWSGRRR